LHQHHATGAAEEERRAKFERRLRLLATLQVNMTKGTKREAYAGQFDSHANQRIARREPEDRGTDAV